MNLHRLLKQREADHKPLRVALLGARKFGAMFMSQAPRTPGMRLVAVADLTPDRARAALTRVGWPATALNAASPGDALKNGKVYFTDDPLAVIASPEVDIVIDATGHDFALLRRCWIYGSDLDLRLLRVDSRKNHETLARYMTKELREVQDYESRPGLHGWSCTRNARRPEVDVMIADDSFRLEIPAGCESLQCDPNVIKYRTA